MFFDKSGIDQGSKGFHWFLKRALSHGFIMIYDGNRGVLEFCQEQCKFGIGSLHRCLPLQERWDILVPPDMARYSFYINIRAL